MKFLWTIAVTFGGFYLIALSVLYLSQDRLLFPAPNPGDTSLPAGAETFETKSSDGAVLRHVRLANADNSPKLIFFHGNGSLAAFEIQRGMALWRSGFDVLLAEYRGYGGSTGVPSAKHLLSDGLETYDQFVGRSQSGKVFLYAHSLGAGVATHIANRRSVDGIVLEAPYASLAAIAAERFPMFPVRALFKHEINSAAAAENLTVPIMLIHGEEDRVIPIHHGEKLFSSLKSPTKVWREIPKANHNDLLLHGALELTIDFFSQFK